MRLDDECRLSYYKQIASLNDEHNVYLVQHISDKRVYVKKILTIYNIEVFEYLQEHPISNMPRIYEIIVDEGRLIIIEEYITGTTLQQMLDEQGAMEENLVKDIIRQLCIILNDLHNAHPPIVHRDIKPSNIMVSPDHVVKLIDMNAAKWSLHAVGQDTVLMGTAGYAAPEQYGFAVSNTKTDIYSVGVLMNVMLTGVSPLERLAGEPMGRIVSRCVKMEANKRYDNILDVYKAVGGTKEKEPVDVPTYRYPYAPPGFRNLSPLWMSFSAFMYYCVFYFSLFVNVSSGSMVDLWLTRVVYTLTFAAIILFTGNYLGVQQKMGVPYIRQPILRFISKWVFGMSIMVIGLVFLGILQKIIL